MGNLQLALMKAAMCGGAVSVAAVAVVLLWPQLAGACRAVRKRPVWERVLIAWFVAALIAYGGSKMPTNGVDQSKSGVEVEQWNLSTCSAGQSEQESNLHCTTTTTDYDYLPPTVTPEDIARGWRLWEVRTNADWSAAMPEGAALCTNWWMRGAYEDVVRIGIRDQGSGISGWRFPFGSNEWDSAWAFTWGKLRFALRDRATEIAAVGAPMAAVPYRSRLWTAADTNGSRLVTWENFTLGRVPAANYYLPTTNYQLPTTNYQLVSAQIELRRNGDFVTRSNGVETVCRRIEPFDWDGDGIVNELDANPLHDDGDCFGQGEGWVRANFTNADEIVQAGGYDRWAWGRVGEGLENGYYVLSAFVEDERTVRLDVGDMSVVATNAGEYVFLLEKGVRYDLGFEPSDAEVWYDAADDAAQRPMMMSTPRLGVTASGGWEGAGWRGGDGYLILNPPPYYWSWYVLWLPRLYVTPMTWRPTDTTPTETFTAEFADVTGSFAPSGFSWWGEEHLVSIASPSAPSTQITSIWHGHGDAPYMSVTANVAGEEISAVFYTEHIGYHETTNGASVSIWFDRPAVIYEDPYTNMPGEVVHPAKSNVVLRCVAYGGVYGGTLTLARNGAFQRKLSQVGGDLLPSSVQVPSETALTFEAEYEPVAPSDAANDIVATASLVEDFLNETHTNTSSFTSVKVELEAEYEAPENPNPSRHIYGVGEKVRFKITPQSSEIKLKTDKLDTGDDGFRYELFDGQNETDSSSTRTYICPISASYHPPIRIIHGDVIYRPSILLVEPNVVITPEADWDGCHSLGTVGQSTLVTTSYIGPMNVSFRGIMVAEIPCNDVITPTGYFSTENYASYGFLSHTANAGAGISRRIQPGNRWATDRAGGGAYPNWCPGRLEWKIPVGWVRLLSDAQDFGGVEGVGYERRYDSNSRALLIGNRTDAYKQVMTIGEDGTSKIEKFGHWLTRGRYCRIILDGVTKQWTHLH